MNTNWSYIPFSQIVEWQEKSKIKSGDGKAVGKYKMFICSDTAVKKYDESLVDKEALIFGTGGKASLHYCNEKFAYSTDCVVACKKDNRDCNNLKFYYYYLRQNRMQLLQKDFTGSGLQHTSKKKIGALMVPLPDIDEQNKIVAKIEELFSELDKAVDTLQNIKKQLAVYRQAVLKEAFEGKLTKEWRKNHPNILPESDFKTISIKNPIYKDTAGDENEIRLDLPQKWMNIRIGDIFLVEVGATPSRRYTQYWGGNINWVSSGEVKFNHIYKTEEYITAEGLSHASTNVHPVGTVMLAIIGEGKTRGQAAILEVPAAHNQNTAAILVSLTPCQPKYLYYFFQMSYENNRRVGSGNNQKALNKERVRALHFPFTSFAEQQKVVDAIESRFSVCDNLEKTIDTALLQSEALRQTILKQAFEGELIK